MTEQFKAATIRALYGAILTAALTLLTTYQSGDPADADRWEKALIAAGTALLSYLLARGMAEGLIDSNRGPTSADVGQPLRSPGVGNVREPVR